MDPCKFGKSINCWIHGVSPNLLRRSCFTFSFVGHMVYKFWTLSSSHASFYGWTLPSCRASLLVEIERFVTGGELTRSILGTVPSGAMLELWCRKHCRFVLLGTIPSHRNTVMKTVLFFSPFGNNTVPIFFFPTSHSIYVPIIFAPCLHFHKEIYLVLVNKIMYRGN